MTTLFSTRWHRVAGLRPRLRAGLLPRRQQLRGERWVLLTHPAGTRSVRLNAAAYALAGRLDGCVSVQQLWDWQLAQPGDPATQDEIVDMLAQLREAALLELDHAADFDRLLPHLDRLDAARRSRSLIAWRIPLGDPGALLDRLQRLGALLFSRAGLAVWLAAVLLLLVLAVQHGPTLWAHGQRWLATPRFALLATLLFVPIKALHELAHGLAVRRWGGAVREAGVTLMLGMPLPYVDASAASAFPRRRQRAIVSAAGVMAEALLAALALPLWLWLDDGLARDACFATLVVAGVSTLLFNLNPLQRMDGYYLATDLLALPNLGPRSRAWWLDLLQRRLLGVAGTEPMPVARGERPWLAAYAPLAWLYAIVLFGWIVFWLGQISFTLGLACGALLAWQMLLRPAVRLWGQLRRTALARDGTAGRWRRLSIGGAAVLALALFAPLPQRLLVQGVVWPADRAQIRADEDGFVATLHARDGEPAQPGALVLTLVNPQLAAEVERQRARIESLEAALFDALPDGGAEVGRTRAEIAAAQAALDRLLERVAGLEVKVLTAGRIALPQAADLPGQFVRRGALLGQVLGDDAGTVRVALPEADADRLQRVAPGASVSLSSAPDTILAGTLLRDSQGATHRLPSAALSRRHGGDVETDPADPDALKPLHPVVLLDVRLVTPAGHGRLGERAWVRFDAGFAPLAWQAVQAVRRQVLQRFNPQV